MNSEACYLRPSGRCGSVIYSVTPKLTPERGERVSTRSHRHNESTSWSAPYVWCPEPFSLVEPKLGIRELSLISASSPESVDARPTKVDRLMRTLGQERSSYEEYVGDDIEV
jgi:hypothetical protein